MAALYQARGAAKIAAMRLAVLLAIAGCLGGLGCLGCRAADEVAQTEPRAPAPPPQTPRPTPAPTPERAPPRAAAEATLGVTDVGVFSDLDAQVQLELPADLDAAATFAVIDDRHQLLVLYAAGQPAKVYPIVDDGLELGVDERRVGLRPGDHRELEPLLRQPGQLRRLAAEATPAPGDADADGIPDPLDISLGALKTTLNAATYDQGYVALPYPGGDVPRERGACTDVIVRALRNAGIDLQLEVHEDIARNPRRYPMVERANDDIDHRRVRTILPWFRAHWTRLDADEPGRPGDVVFMETIEERAGPDHIGVLGTRRTDSGELLVANNWTDGYQTAFMDLLAFVEVTDRFRAPPATAHAGPIPATARQLILVRGVGWDDIHGRGQRYERAEVGGDWRSVGEEFAVVFGHAGLAWGRGLHGEGAPRAEAGPSKREGDGRSPAGVFRVGEAYGRAETSASALAYTRESEGLRCVDDPSSAHYNRIVDTARVDQDWSSAEPMRRYYDLAIAVEHNAGRDREAGSCIFLHRWKGPDTPVTGCTAMASETLDALAAWLEPGAVIATLPESSLPHLRARWGLPDPAP